MKERDEIAMRIFCALLSRPQQTIDVHTDVLAERQIRTSFALADAFLKVAAEHKPGDPEVPTS